MKITKDQVLEAIDQEPLLTAGNFSLFDFSSGECEVCAVGAVIKNTCGIIHPTDIRKIGEHECTFGSFVDYNTLNYDSNSPLGKISSAFEYAYSETKDLELARLMAMMEAENSCPDELEIDLD